MSMRSKTLLWFCGMTLAHYAATFGTLLASFGSSMDRFDSGRAASAGDKFIGAANDVLSFPILPILKFLPIHFPGIAGHLPFFANSALWAAAIVAVALRLRKKEAIQQPQQQRP